MMRIFKHLIFRLMLKLFLGLGRVLKKSQLKTLSIILGNIFFLVPLKRKAIALENMKIAFANYHSRRELGRILKEFYKEIILMILEISHNISNRDSLLTWASVKGIEHLDEALKKGNGVIALSAHFSNIPVLIAWFAEKGYPVAVLFKEGKYLPEKFLFNLISSYNIHPIPFQSDKDVPKEIIRALNKGMIVFILADQARPGVYARFFGKYVQCQKGAFVISYRKGAPILPIFILREKERYKILVYPELKKEGSDHKGSISEEQIIAMIEEYNQILENIIRIHPEQYYWFHRRFKKMQTQ